jgi:mRNA interferase MazF
MSDVPNRGDVVLVNFPEPDDVDPGEFEKPHPAVVVQNNSDNRQKKSTIVVPVTSGTDPDPLTEVLLTPENDGVENRSIAILNQITTVSISGKIKDQGSDSGTWKMGEVHPDTMRDIENKLAYVLNL